jgi:hypothetical protein
MALSNLSVDIRFGVVKGWGELVMSRRAVHASLQKSALQLHVC